MCVNSQFRNDTRKLVPSPFGRGARGEGLAAVHERSDTSSQPTALTLTLSQRERGQSTQSNEHYGPHPIHFQKGEGIERTALTLTLSQRERGLFICNLKRLHPDQSGAMSIIAVFAVLGLTMLLGMAINVGRQTDGKLRMQNAADAAAYSGGVVMARGLNTLAFTNHLLCDVLATTAWMREAQGRNAESHVPSILAAWQQEAPVFSGSGFQKFQSLGAAIQQKVPLEQELVRSYGDWAYSVSEAVLPLMETILSEELIPQYQRAVAAAFPDIAQTAAREIAKLNGQPDYGRGTMLGALWRANGQLVGGDYELADPSLPVVDPELGAEPNQSHYQELARQQRERLARAYLADWNNQTLAFFDAYGKMSQFGALWRSYTCGHLRKLLEEEYPDRNLPFQIRTTEDDLLTPDARNQHLLQYFTFVGVVYWKKIPVLAPGLFNDPIEGDVTAFAEVRVYVPRRRLVWLYSSYAGGWSPTPIGGVPGEFPTLPNETPPDVIGGGGGSGGYWFVGREPVPDDWTLLCQRWTCQLAPADAPALATILQTVPPLPEFAEREIVLPSLGSAGVEEIMTVSPH
jgi:hypothetical protein